MSDVSEREELEGELEIGEEEGASIDSLEARMAQRAKQIEEQTSDIFPVPLWEDMLAVELRFVGWTTGLRKIVERHKKVRDPAVNELYIAADQVLLATEGFYMVSEGPKGEVRTKANTTWVQLARATGKKLPDNLSARQAMVALMGDTNVLFLWNTWQDWMRSERGTLEEEVVQDFSTTQ
jgi:hypothetical protein